MNWQQLITLIVARIKQVVGLYAFYIHTDVGYVFSE